MHGLAQQAIHSCRHKEQQIAAHLPASAVLAVAALLTSSMSPPPSIDILFAVLVEDVRSRRRTAGAFSGSATDAGAAGATGERRRLLALMLKEGGLPFLAFSAPLLTASLLACRQLPCLDKVPIQLRS